MLIAWVKANIHSKYVFLLLLNLALVVKGSFMDVFSAIIVVVPLITPLGESFGIDPVQLAIIFLANLELGYLTPPVGMNLCLSAYRFRKPMSEVYRATLPFYVILLVGVLLITYVPFLTTAPARWLGY
jgi:TRAP-type C4-dicarboxylate transport system permease large subunit